MAKHFIRRSLAATAVTTLVLITTTAADTSAAVILQEHFESSDSGSTSVCGLDVDYERTGSVTVTIRQGPAGAPTEFWSWVGSFREVLTNPENGAFIIISGRFNNRDVRATLIQDDVYRYRVHSAGQGFVVENSDGKVVYRERGLLAYDVWFDHGAPEGERFLGAELVAERGFPGAVDDLCPGFLALMT